MRFAVLFHRLGPYHVARLRAAAAAGRGEIVAVELSGSGGEYAWDPVESPGLTRVTAHPAGDSRDLPAAELAACVRAALDRARPDVLAVAGWSDKGMLAAARWGRARRVPLVVMSDSQYHDEPRVWWKEAVKRQVVGEFQAGFVAGTTHVEYLARLGMPRDRIATGYDVVDNDHFARGADAARADAGRLRAALGLPERYFLTCGRFVPKKNLATLLDAYAGYRRSAGPAAWGMVVVGDGPLRPALEAQAERLGLRGAVAMPGFLQYQELPAYYGLASAFVLPSVQDQWGLVVNEAMAAGLPVLVSRVCGCAPDLVREGENGFTFDPRDAAGLGRLLGRVAADPGEAARLGGRGRAVIGDWSLRRFADGLWAAAAAALRPSRAPRLGGRFALAALTR